MAGRGRGRGRGVADVDFLAALAENMQQFQQQQQHFQEQQQEFQQQQQQFQQQQHQPHQPNGQAFQHSLNDFCRRNPPRFEGGFAPDAVHDWIQDLEKIFRALQCTNDQKVTYAIYMLSREAEDWWTFVQQQMEYDEQAVTWIAFKNRFLNKYFPDDLRVKKEMEFLKLQQGSLSIGEYATKFEALAKYAPHYNQPGNERSKCAKFEDGLRTDLNLAFAHQQIHDFSTLVSKCRIYEDGIKARNAVYKTAIQQRNSVGPTRNTFGQRQGQMQGRGKPFYYNQKPYTTPSESQQRDVKPATNNNNQQRAPIGNSNNPAPFCDKCKGRHPGPNCLVCFNCNQLGHIRPNCPQLKGGSRNAMSAAKPQVKGKVFTMSGEEVEEGGDLIQGTCLLQDNPLHILFDSGATHSFISLDIAKRLGLPINSLPYDLVVSTPTNKPVTISSICSKCPIVLNNKTFLVDLICLPLSQLDIILGMDWLSANHVLLNCLTKTIIFHDPKNPIDSVYETKRTSTHQLENFIEDGTQVFVMLASMKKKSGGETQIT